MDQPIHLLLISGSLRDGSTNTAVLNTARMLAGDGVETVLYGEMGELPHFNPDDDREGQPVHAAVAKLRAERHQYNLRRLPPCTPTPMSPRCPTPWASSRRT